MALDHRGDVGALTDSSGDRTVEAEELKIGEGCDISVAGLPEKDGGFTNVVAEAVDLQLASVALYRSLAAGDDVEVAAIAAAGNEFFTGADADLFCRSEKISRAAYRQVRK